MATQKDTRVYSAGTGEPSTYLDIQAAVGITKHIGGYPATDTLHRLCHLADAEEVLEIGCGIGVGPAYVAKRFDCRVTAVDLSERMLDWARERAIREGVADRITFRQADLRELPFDDHAFDAVILESVLAFVEDKDAAIRELVRVTKPGGYVGLNETYWREPLPPEYATFSFQIGPEIITEAEWREIWAAAPFAERTIEAHALDAKTETRDRIKWIGWRTVLAGWGRTIKLLLTDRASRQSIKGQFAALKGSPSDIAGRMGYALFVGRKAGSGER